jgi:hypothetical protein
MEKPDLARITANYERSLKVPQCFSGYEFCKGSEHKSGRQLVRARSVLDEPVSSIENTFSLDSGKIPADSQETRKLVEGK